MSTSSSNILNLSQPQIATLSPPQLNSAITTCFTQRIDSFDQMMHVAKSLSTKIPDHTFSEAHLSIMAKHAQYYLQCSQNQAKSTWQGSLDALSNRLVLFFEGCLFSFGVAEFFQPPANRYQREAILRKITTLIGFWGAVAGVLMPYLGDATVPTLGTAFISIALLSLLYPTFKPTPYHLPLAHNWTREYRQGLLGDLTTIKGRTTVLDQLYEVLTAKKGGRRVHPLLVGETGVGKTETVKAFVRAIEEGRYPKLKNKRIFYINVPTMFSGGFQIEDPLQQLINAIGTHRDDVVLVLDEMHVACQNAKGSATSSDQAGVLAEKLKAALDPTGALPMVIGITTEKEFEAHIKPNTAFVNRFRRIDVSNTGTATTESVLAHQKMLSHKTALFAKGAFKEIVIASSSLNGSQPQMACRLFKKCLHLTATPLPPTAEKVRALQAQKRALLTSSVAECDDTKSDDSQDLETIDRALAKALAAVAKEETQINGVLALQKSRAKLEAMMHRLVAQNASHNMVYLLQRFMLPLLLSEIKTRAQHYKINVVVDKTIIEKAITELIPSSTS